jgi:hypothetical protein
MIIKYVGQKPKMTVNLPIGSGRMKSTSKVHFSPGATYDFSTDEGQKLLNLDYEIISFNDMRDDILAKTEQVTQLPDGKYRYQFNFVEVKNGKEEEKEETSVLVKKKGRPFKKVADDHIDNI